MGWIAYSTLIQWASIEQEKMQIAEQEKKKTNDTWAAWSARLIKNNFLFFSFRPILSRMPKLYARADATDSTVLHVTNFPATKWTNFA